MLPRKVFDHPVGGDRRRFPIWEGYVIWYHSILAHPGPWNTPITSSKGMPQCPQAPWRGRTCFGAVDIAVSWATGISKMRTWEVAQTRRTCSVSYAGIARVEAEPTAEWMYDLPRLSVPIKRGSDCYESLSRENICRYFENMREGDNEVL
jgi:hypothetical protein